MGVADQFASRASLRRSLRLLSQFRYEQSEPARFYSALLGRPITYADPDWVVVAEDDRHSGLAFQRAPDHRAPTWPDPEIPQQIHLDVMVEDVAAAAPEVVSLGARHLRGDVYADPAGHPFCLIKRPGWAPPIPPD